jgi:hypothetical protein
MQDSSFDRRRFNELTAAALGGLVAGATIGCGNAQVAKNESKANTTAAEKHLCRGLNGCKGEGKSGKNECRGQGDCATLAPHDCGGHNDCKGQGGCGESVGLNDCKTKGGCAVPLMDGAWKTVRERLEKKWKEGNQEFKAAPAKAV